ncbi:small multidrug resistance pump [Luteibacter rhizovicinus]|uniref:Small multidrug resistance pump n=1 Tax=Luteibacter rhizovicinus TaxID=242606 RepID=A0A4R3YQE0_9GAMM|nr:multidrug efflux SMR transporter [Luteibacter rhizovicinus]TCV94552.1 small multidrug resistance pump [Luteibacter rhizovicinus]
MNWLSYLALLGAIVFEVVGTTSLKASEGFSKTAPTVVSLAAYGIAFYFLSLTLRHIPVAIAYAIWSGLGIVLIAAVGWIRFGQKLDAWGLTGIGLILAGVLVVNLLSKSVEHG